MVLRPTDVVRARHVRCRALVVDASEWILVLVGRQLAAVVQDVPGGDRDVVRGGIAQRMVVEGDRLHGPLLRVLKITVHAVLLRVAPKPVKELGVFVLLIPVHLAVGYLVDAVVRFFLSFVIDFAFVDVVEVFLAIRGLAFVVIDLVVDLLLFERRMCLVVRAGCSLRVLLFEVQSLFMFRSGALGRIVAAAA